MLLMVVFVCGAVLVAGFPEGEQYVVEEILEGDDGGIGEEAEDGGVLRATLNANETEETHARVLYTGSQVWKVKIESSKQLRVLSELRKQKGKD